MTIQMINKYVYYNLIAFIFIFQKSNIFTSLSSSFFLLLSCLHVFRDVLLELINPLRCSSLDKNNKFSFYYLKFLKQSRKLALLNLVSREGNFQW